MKIKVNLGGYPYMAATPQRGPSFASSIIAKQNYPCLYEALDLIAATDNKGGYSEYSVDAKYAEHLPTFEAWLNGLSDRERDGLCLASFKEAQDVADRLHVGRLLTVFIADFKGELL